ncbi:helix-turn-helix domain-containing protein [Sphingobium sp. B8D3A]|uniref:helix-turn-helix domain-containing protein n=1 Tax=unclassified Sphingobium TaxID=2611147 RepID=UPI0039B680F8|nr:putative DNA-binding transcriptional regulator AlpA [Sphingobium sp. B8D3D]MCW2414265.1 putative DNA-binding transcriptional regulator AlpA [Sphingobium sp. B8D3A]
MHIHKKTITVAQFCEMSGIGKTLTYELIRDGRLKVCKVNRRTLITMDSANTLLCVSTEH